MLFLGKMCLAMFSQGSLLIGPQNPGKAPCFRSYRKELSCSSRSLWLRFGFHLQNYLYPKTTQNQNLPLLISLAGFGQVRVSPPFHAPEPCSCRPMEKNCPDSSGTQGQNWDSTSNIACCDRLEEIVGTKYFMSGVRKGQVQPCPAL